MNNNLYHWHDEHAVRYEMHEIYRAVEQARLLREAGLAGQGWLTRALHVVHGLGNLMNALGKSLQARRSVEPRTYQQKSPRSA